MPVRSGRDSHDVIHADTYAGEGTVERGIAEGKDTSVEPTSQYPPPSGVDAMATDAKYGVATGIAAGVAAEAEDPPTRGSNATPTSVATAAPIRNSFFMVPP